MIFYLLIFFIILSVSLVLAYLSMKNYQEIPDALKEYGIYLVKKPNFLTLQVLGMLLDLCQGKLLSFERLFKGNLQVLVIFGPKKILSERFSEILGLLELEDYTRVSGDLIAWEVGRKETGEFAGDIFKNFPALDEDEQFFWQVILNGNHGQIRAVLFVQDIERKKILVSTLENIGGKLLHKIPKPFTSAQIFENYRKRIFIPSFGYKLTKEEILRFTGLLHN